MEIGVSLGHTGDTLDDTTGFCVHAEQVGLPFAGFGDVPSLFREVYGLMTAAALATERIKIGPTVTNPVIRHPLVTASSIATVDEAAHGRAFLGIGTGNASVKNVGAKTAKVADLEAAVIEIQNGFQSSSDRAAGQGGADERHSGLQWPARKVPVYISAGTGKRSMKVAAEQADGVILHTVVGDPELATKRIEQIREMRAAGPRAGEPFKIWAYAPGWIADSLEECHEVLGPIVTGSLGIFDFSRPIEGIEPDMQQRLKEFEDAYVYSAHAAAGANDNVELMERFGVTEFMYGRIALYGDEAGVAEKLANLEEAGLDGVLVSGAIPDKSVLIERLGSLQQRMGAPEALTR
jgi:5,10-methylenetetrahydromethanopterin reductase